MVSKTKKNGVCGIISLQRTSVCLFVAAAKCCVNYIRTKRNPGNKKKGRVGWGGVGWGGGRREFDFFSLFEGKKEWK
jgi:hypothetical protein